LSSPSPITINATAPAILCHGTTVTVYVYVPGPTTCVPVPDRAPVPPVPVTVIVVEPPVHRMPGAVALATTGVELLIVIVVVAEQPLTSVTV